MKLVRPLTLFAAMGIALGCGGELPSAFVNAVYVEIQNGGSLVPATIQAPSGGRIVFLNSDVVSHTIHWQSPMTLTATVEPGERTWFDLPQSGPGTIFSYRLDDSGATGSVTMVIDH